MALIADSPEFAVQRTAVFFGYLINETPSLRFGIEFSGIFVFDNKFDDQLAIAALDLQSVHLASDW